ncbi:MAG: acylneuraminate cytidylyltransferase family protein [Epsilonproteobacteria bacterium]|nr:MAG: acylneuraminate cytidylyltransferase family protein [Campylobacterota bacterium]
MTKKILAIIPARGGSKGIPKKNIVNLAGKPLLAWTIKASLNSKYITKTVVSSDDINILNIAKKYKSDTIQRPSNLALDTASSEPVLLHLLKSLEQKFDYLVLLQPTSPLRDSIEIDNAFNLFFKSDATALISVCRAENKMLKAFMEDDNGYIKGIVNNIYPFMRRQDLPNTYLSNGAIYIIKTSEFIKNSSLITDKTISYIMSEVKSIDIDNVDDLNRASRHLK